MNRQWKFPWMRTALLAAAGYNVCCAAWVVAAPLAVFSMAGLPAPNYPELLQCIGMFVGVLGIGYALAAADPRRHWPVVAVGLMSKVLGPAGFVWAASTGRLPWNLGWAVLANDVAWWAPFALILKRTYETHRDQRRAFSPDVLDLAMNAKAESGESLEQLSREAPLLLVFLRHAGCTFCREALSDLARQRRQIESAGVQIALVHMGEPDYGREFFAKYGLSDIPQISDRKCALYRAFGLQRGSLMMLFGPKVWIRGVEAGIVQGHGMGRLRGDGFQMPGVFLLFHGQILRSYRHQSAADRPDYVRFVTDENLLRTAR